MDAARHFGLAADPFGPTITPAEAFESGAYRAARDQLLHELDRGGRLVVLVGAAGTGKSLLLRATADRLEAAGRRVRRIDRGDMAAGAPLSDADVLLIDEADRMAPAAREALARAAAEPGHPAVVLACIRRCLDHLAGPLAPRIVTLAALDQADARDLVLDRITRAGGRPSLFAPGALSAITYAAGGSPRLLRLLSGGAMFHAAHDGARLVEMAHARRAIAMQKGASEIKTPMPEMPRSLDLSPRAERPLPTPAAQVEGVARALPSVELREPSVAAPDTALAGSATRALDPTIVAKRQGNVRDRSRPPARSPETSSLVTAHAAPAAVASSVAVEAQPSIATSTSAYARPAPPSVATDPPVADVVPPARPETPSGEPTGGGFVTSGRSRTAVMAGAAAVLVIGGLVLLPRDDRDPSPTRPPAAASIASPEAGPAAREAAAAKSPTAVADVRADPPAEVAAPPAAVASPGAVDSPDARSEPVVEAADAVRSNAPAADVPPAIAAPGAAASAGTTEAASVSGPLAVTVRYARDEPGAADAASRVADLLRAHGYDSVAISPEQGRIAQASVRYPPGEAAAAEAVNRIVEQALRAYDPKVDSRTAPSVVAEGLEIRIPDRAATAARPLRLDRPPQ